MREFHIHGDNVIECERMIEYIEKGLNGAHVTYSFASPACPQVTMSFPRDDTNQSVKFLLYPGFNKTNGSRWKSDIYEPLKKNGSILDETPDALITRINNSGDEEVLVAIEFCSALQAGNQAWQRSGRAFSTSRSGCPYLYIVDFVKYELDKQTRQRKALRFPNPAVVYSYINHSNNSGVFCTQVYVRAEEFQPSFDSDLSGFSDDYFGDEAFSQYLVAKLLGEPTHQIECLLLEKNMKVVDFLTSRSGDTNCFKKSDWDFLYRSKRDVIEYAAVNGSFSCSKKIANKSVSSESVLEFRDLVKEMSVGIGSQDLPIGIISKNNLDLFKHRAKAIYPEKPNIDSIPCDSNLIVCLIKGFKPRGDDNRPDRGLLPLVAMLSNTRQNVLTFIYGPLLDTSYKQLLTDPKKLAGRNGLWKAVLSLSDYILLDCPVLHGATDSTQQFLCNTGLKDQLLKVPKSHTLSMSKIPSEPCAYSEDDVDTALHVLFSKSLKIGSFECMCNPPGGDWSGFSVKRNNIEYRWLSLPRVSNGGKRPDHIAEIFGLGDKPILLVVESKGQAKDLEASVGTQLIKYIDWLMKSTPSAERADSHTGEWTISHSRVSPGDYTFISAGAFLRNANNDYQSILSKSSCDILFDVDPIPTAAKWSIQAISKNETALKIAKEIGKSLAIESFDYRVIDL